MIIEDIGNRVGWLFTPSSFNYHVRGTLAVTLKAVHVEWGNKSKTERKCTCLCTILTSFAVCEGTDGMSSTSAYHSHAVASGTS